MTPLQVLEGTFPAAECRDNRAAWSLQRAREDYHFRTYGAEVGRVMLEQGVSERVARYVVQVNARLAARKAELEAAS